MGIIGIITSLFYLGVSIAAFEGILDTDDDAIAANDGSVKDADEIEKEEDEFAMDLFIVSAFSLALYTTWTIMAGLGLHGVCVLQANKLKHFSNILNLLLIARMIVVLLYIIVWSLPLIAAAIIWAWHVGLEYYFAKIVWSTYMRLLFNEITVVVYGPNVLVRLPQDSSRMNVQMIPVPTV